MYFDNFFNSTLLISKLFKKGIYGVGTAQRNRRGMPALPYDKKMKRGDANYQFSTTVGCCKWMNNRSVRILFSSNEGMKINLSVQHRVKGSAAVSCPDVIKFYIGRVDLVDQRTAAYYLDRKSSMRFYLRIFFDLMNVVCASSYYIAFNMLHPDHLTFLNFKITVAAIMIRPYTSRKKATPNNNIGSKRVYRCKHERTKVPNHLPEFQQSRYQCVYCYAGDIDK